MNIPNQSTRNDSRKNTPSHVFKKQHRLLGPNDFKSVFTTPIKKIHTTHLLAFVAKGATDEPRLGLAITKKKLKHAVVRNRIKRLTREAFRQNRENLTAIDVVVIVKVGYDKEFRIGEEVGQLFSKINQKFSKVTKKMS